MDSGKLIVQRHPLIIDHDTQVVLDLNPGESLFLFLHRHIPNLDPNTMTVQVGGKVVPSHLWHHVYLKDGQRDIVVRSTVHKSALYIVAMIALTAFTAGAGATVAAGGTFLGLSGATAMAAIGAIQVVGALVINKVLGPKMSAPDRAERDSVYSLGAARNQVRPYEPYGLLFGEVMVTPDYLSKPYSQYRGNEQYLSMLLTPGINVAAFEPLMIGDTPISNYEDVQVWQRGFPAMSEQVIPISTNVDTIAGGELKPLVPVVRTTPINTVRIQVDISALLFDLTSKGKKKNNQETVRIEYRKVGDAGWTLGGNNLIVSKEQSELRRSYFYTVDSGQYEVRVQRLGQDTDGSGATAEFTLVSITAYQTDDANYDGVGVIGLEMKASGQLNGTPDQIRSVMRAKPLEVWNGTAWVTATTRAEGLSNPAANVLRYIRGYYDGAGNLIAGMGWPDSQIDLESFKGWILNCQELGLTYDAWITGDRSHDEMLKAIALAGMGDVDFSPGKATAIYAAENQPNSAVINMGNIKKASFQVDYTLASAADGIEYTYFDRTVWENRTIRVKAPGVTGDMQNPAKISGEGVTEEDAAAIMARWHMGQMIYQFKDVVFSQDLEHLCYGRMSMVQLQHDLTQWGYGGRLRKATNTGGTITLELDDIVPAPSIGNAYIGVRIPGENNYRVFNVATFAGESNTVTLSGPWPSGVPFPGSSADNPAHDYIWIYDFKATPGNRCRVVAIAPEDDLRGAQIAVVPEGPEFWTYVLTGEYTPPNSGSLLNTRPVASNLRVQQELVVQGDTVFLMFHATWEVTGKAEYFTVTVNGKEVAMTTSLAASWRQDEAGEYLVVVRPFGEGGIPGTAVALSINSNGSEQPPVLVDNFDVQETPAGLRLYTWGFNTNTIQSPDFAGVQIRYISGEVTAPSWDDMTQLGNGYESGTLESPQPPAGTWTFACRSVSTSGVLSTSQRVVTRTFTDNIDQIVPTLQDQIDAETGARVAADLALAVAAAQDAQDRADAALAAAMSAINDVDADVAAVDARVDAVSAQVADIISADEWNNTTAYPEGDLVKHDGKLYRARQAVPAGTPTSNTAYWEFLGNYSSLGEAVAGALSIASQTATELEAESTRIDAIVSRMPSGSGTLATAASVTSEQTARVNADTALSGRLDAVEARMPAGSGQLATASSVTALDARVTAAEGTITSQGSAITTIQARLPTGSGQLATAASVTALDSRVTAAEGTITSQGSAITTIQARLPAGSGQLATASAVSSLEGRVTTAENTITAQGNSITAIQARLPSGSGTLATASAVNSLDSRVTAAEGNITALSSSLTSVTSRMPTGSGTLATASAVNSLDSRVTSVEGTVSAQSTQINSVQAQMGAIGNFVITTNFADGQRGTWGSAGTVVTETAHTSQPYALQISASVYEDGAGFRPLKPGDVIDLEWDVHTQSKTSGNVTPTLHWRNKSGTNNFEAFSAATAAAGVSGWQYGKKGSVTVPAGAVEGRLLINFGTAGGTVKFTNVRATVRTPGVQLLSANVTQLMEATATSGGQLRAKYTLAVNSGGMVAGMLVDNDSISSTIDFLADNFRILKPGGGARTEFSGGNWRVYDASGVLRVRMGVW